MSFQMPTKLTSRFLVRPEYGSARSFDFNQNSHTVTLPGAAGGALIGTEGGSPLRYKKVAISTLTAVETTLFTLPAGAIVLDVMVNITDASAEANTIDVGTDGTSNDPNGFFEAIPTNATGLFSARNGFATTAGLNATYLSTKYTGALLTALYDNGADTANLNGHLYTKPAYFSAADPVTYTLSGTTTSFAASVTVVYLV